MIAAGKEAVRHNSIAELIAADMEFHMYVYELSRNRLFVELMQRAVEPSAARDARGAAASRIPQGDLGRARRDPAGDQLCGDGDAAASLVRAHLSQAAINVQVVLPDTALPPR